MELNERVAALEARVCEHDKKLDNLEQLTEATTKLACGVEALSSDMKEIKTDIRETKEKVNNLEDRPGKMSLSFNKWFWGLVGAALVTGCVSLVVFAIKALI